MIVKHIIFGCLKKGHVRQNPHSQGRNDKVDFAECQASSVTGQQWFRSRGIYVQHNIAPCAVRLVWSKVAS